MVLFVTIIKDYRKIEELLLGFIEEGVTGATVVEGRGMGQIIGEIPIFAGVRGLFPGSALDSHLVLAVMDAGLARTCLQLVERIAGSLEEPGGGIAFTIPLGVVKGITPEIA
ncbi:MAG: hypothetical protein KC620_19040 [Myxococcales bacterium]|nr:hypothetical protein [Myxococcales bacterium]